MDDRIRALEPGFRLGDWWIRPHACSIEPVRTDASGDAGRIRVGSKAMQVLLRLAASADEFVAKDELMAAAWAGRVVTDDVLTVAIRTLRRAFGDDARDPRVIETRNNVGYRLIATVALSRRPAEGVARQHKPALVFVATIFAAIAAVAFVWPGEPAPSVPTVAVLPFVGLSDSERELYVATAMTDGLITRLAQRERLRVISRTSVVRYADSGLPLPSIARELGADFLVEGSVLSGNADLRISAQLIDARDDTHLWVAFYDRTVDDLIDVQTDVADRIARDVTGVLAPSRPVPPASYALSGDALDALLAARFHLAQQTADGAERALAIALQLTERFPSAADTHLLKARAELFLFKNYHRPYPVLAEAAASAREAIALDPGNGRAHRALGQIVFLKDWDYAEAERHYRRAIDLNAGDTVARQRYAWLLVSLGRIDDAMAQIDAIRQLDSRYYTSVDGAMLLLFTGQFEATIAELRRIEAAAPPSEKLLRIRSLAYWGLGRLDASAQALILSREAAGSAATNADALHAAFASEGSAGVFRMLIADDVFASPVSRAGLYAQIGDHEMALQWLDRAISGRDPQVLFVQSRPEFFAMHTDPRFRALVRRINSRH